MEQGGATCALAKLPRDSDTQPSLRITGLNHQLAIGIPPLTFLPRMIDASINKQNWVFKRKVPCKHHSESHLLASKMQTILPLLDGF